MSSMVTYTFKGRLIDSICIWWPAEDFLYLIYELSVLSLTTFILNSSSNESYPRSNWRSNIQKYTDLVLDMCSNLLLKEVFQQHVVQKTLWNVHRKWKKWGKLLWVSCPNARISRKGKQFSFLNIFLNRNRMHLI